MTGTGDATARALSLRLFQGMLATQESFVAYLGVKLGIYEALHRGGPATVDQLAARTGLAVRYLREWLEQQATAGLIAVDGPAGSWKSRTYHLPAGHERVLTASGDELSMVSTALLPLGAVAAALPRLLTAFQDGDGIPAEAYGEDWRAGHGGANRALYTSQLAGWLRRYLPEIDQRLAGGPARVADVACGSGWAGIALALAYPRVEVDAVDLDGGAVDQAARNARDRGVADRMTFRVADAAVLAGQPGYDLVCLFDALHELGRPVDALRACRALCHPGGAVLVLDAQVADGWRVPGNEIERFQYATSVLHCLPAALYGDGAEGTGTVLRPATVRQFAADAGFSAIREFDLPDRFHRWYRLSG